MLVNSRPHRPKHEYCRSHTTSRCLGGMESILVSNQWNDLKTWRHVTCEMQKVMVEMSTQPTKVTHIRSGNRVVTASWLSNLRQIFKCSPEHIWLGNVWPHEKPLKIMEVIYAILPCFIIWRCPWDQKNHPSWTRGTNVGHGLIGNMFLNLSTRSGICAQQAPTTAKINAPQILTHLNVQE